MASWFVCGQGLGVDVILVGVIVANLHNAKTGRFHPVFFSESPLPGLPSCGKPIRHKSRGHHAKGFELREDALAKCREFAGELKNESVGTPKLRIEKDLPWDGLGLPVMVRFFGELEG